MQKNNVTDRLEFLAKRFDVFEHETPNQLSEKHEALIVLGYQPKPIEANGKILALVSVKENLEHVERSLIKISVSLDVFSNMVAADPTPNKSCVQWMLNVFSRYLRNSEIISAIRFVTEDLPQASEYLLLFEANKRKNRFKELASTSYVLMNVKDYMDINQYKSLTHLFDAVDPFIIREPSEVERQLLRFVNSGQAIIPVKDRMFTVYIPKTRDASTVFANFATWCTARAENGMFSSYTNELKPNGKKSDLYIIINNGFFTGESDGLYQIHFETKQIKDRRNSQVSIFEDVINESEGVSNFFYKELMGMAKSCKTGLDNNIYLDFLIKFGFCESLFEVMDENTPTIRIMTREIPKLWDLSRFTMLDQLIIVDAKLVEIHPSIGKLKNLEILSLPNNRIKSLPKEIGLLKNLTFLNLKGNNVSEIPSEIKYLDKSNGGSLWRMVVEQDEIGEENYQKLKELLPTTLFN